MKFWRILTASYLGLFLLVGPLPFNLMGASSAPLCTEEENQAFMTDLACAMLKSENKDKWPVDANIRIKAQVNRRQPDGSRKPAVYQEVAFIADLIDANNNTITSYGMRTDVCDQQGIARAYYTVRFDEGDSLRVEIIADYPDDGLPRKKIYISGWEIKDYISDTNDYTYEFPTQIIEVLNK